MKLNLHAHVYACCGIAGFLGGFNAVCLLPMVLVMHYAGVESLDNLTVPIFFFIVMKGLFDNVLSDMLWARSIMLTSPTVATVGA
jgi:solute carrier family 35 protein F5